jgi:putative transcriptional regulator
VHFLLKEKANRRVGKGGRAFFVQIVLVLCSALLFREVSVGQEQPSFFQFTAVFPLQRTSQSVAELATGRFLVASRHLFDPNFSETVVLLTEYTSEGAMGVVINRPTEIQLSEVLPEIKELQQRKDLVYIGGPGARTAMLLLVRSNRRPEGAHPVFDDIYVSGSRTVLKQMTKSAAATSTFRAYAGYAGWAPGQLDQEVARGDWYILPADAATIFEKASDSVWPELIRRGAVEWTRRQRPNLNEAIHAVSQRPVY